MSNEDVAAPGASFAQRLDYLFEHIRPPGKPDAQYSNRDVAEGAKAKGYSITAMYVWQLRTGKRDNPGLSYVEALAAFFGVPATYFLDPEVQRLVEAQISLVASLRDAGVHNLAMRAHGLSPEGLAAIESMIDHVRALERLPAADDLDGKDESSPPDSPPT